MFKKHRDQLFRRDADARGLRRELFNGVGAELNGKSAVRHAGMIAEVVAPAYVFSTNVSITFFSPAFSKSTTSLLPSMARIAP